MAKKRRKRKKNSSATAYLILLGLFCIIGLVGLFLFLKKPKAAPDPETDKTENIKVEVKPGQGQEEIVARGEKRRQEQKEKELQEALSVVSEDKADAGKEGYVEVHFIDVGQGDSILVKYIDTFLEDGDDSENLLIDAGDNNKGTLVRNYLKKNGVKELKYFICTHPDADHIGGAASVVSNVPITSEIVWAPAYKKENKTYDNLQNEIRTKYYQYEMPALQTVYSLGKANLVFLGPTEHYDDPNNNSLVCKLSYHDSSILFTGDCSEKEENDLLEEAGGDLKADILKVGHHGSDSSSTKAFLDAVSPVYAVISCGADNSYGHPHKSVLERLEGIETPVLRTDQKGDIICVMDGSHKYQWFY